MRRVGMLFLLIAVAGVFVPQIFAPQDLAAQSLAGQSLAGQDTNFSSGPQYLITTDSTLFLRPIATPSLSFQTPSFQLPSFQSSMTPTPAFEGEAGPGVQTSAEPPAIQTQTDYARVYWGAGTASDVSASVIEISSQQPALPLPASIFDAGVQETSDPQSLLAEGYGVTLGEAASFWKTHRPHGKRVFTNQDVERLHGE